WVELHGAPLSHLVLNAHSGVLYVGGVDHLYQLTSDLEVMSHARTGPHQDSPDCLPPISLEDCPSARLTHNYNKLLLTEPGEGPEPGSLIVCGSLYQGICDKRSLSNISQFIYQTHNPVDTQYVAANDPRVSTVALVITADGKQEGPGRRRHASDARWPSYTSKGPGTSRPSPRGACTRCAASPRLRPGGGAGEAGGGKLLRVQQPFCEGGGARKPRLLPVLAPGHVAEEGVQDVRLPALHLRPQLLLLRGGSPGLPRRLQPSAGGLAGEPHGKAALFVIMAAGQASTPVASSRSALCVYGMAELDAMLLRAQEVCYTGGGRGSSGQEEAYIEYAVSSKCLKLPK
ncbi:unnamed protein product, partial [Tetraodon nigroviridis]